ncbi:MAG TPA: DUF1330 domain-containing protein [Solirubrobacteraceae bacterium]|nr:DUF1330 domain-containing protein [Solirubrobacteraceae bacterium]
MKYYAIAELDMTDDRGWAREYVENVTPMVERRGGRFLARTDTIQLVEGERSVPHLFLIIEWPSQEAAGEFYESIEYQPYRDARIAGTHSQFFLVAGEDVNGVARIE